MFPIKQFSDIETLLPIITLFPISTFASIFEKLPIVKLEPLTEVSEIKELLILTNSDFFSFFIQNSFIKLQKSNFGFFEGITILFLKLCSCNGTFVIQTPLMSFRL